MSFNKKIQTRKTIRLKGYDYTHAAAYFVTICTRHRECYFGDIINGEMKLSVMGRIADQCWNDILNHFTNVQLDEYRVMPNHVHGIIMITNAEANDQPVGARHVVSLHNDEPIRKFGPLPPKSLHTIVGSYKSAVTKLIHRSGHPFAWQSRFHEHIIRNQKELDRIRQYIYDNAAKWDLDKENPRREAEKR